MRREKGTFQKQEAVGAPHSLAGGVKIIRSLDRHRLEPHAERARCHLRPLELDGVGQVGRMPEHGSSLEAGDNCLEQLQALAGKILRGGG